MYLKNTLFYLSTSHPTEVPIGTTVGMRNRRPYGLLDFFFLNAKYIYCDKIYGELEVPLPEVIVTFELR